MQTSRIATVLVLLSYGLGGAIILTAYSTPNERLQWLQVGVVLFGGAVLLADISLRGARAPRATLPALVACGGVWVLLLLAARTWPALSRFPVDVLVVAAVSIPLLVIASRVAVPHEYFRMRWFERLDRRPAWVRYPILGAALAALIVSPAAVFIWFLLWIGAMTLVFARSEIEMAHRLQSDSAGPASASPSASPTSARSPATGSGRRTDR